LRHCAPSRKDAGFIPDASSETAHVQRKNKICKKTRRIWLYNKDRGEMRIRWRNEFQAEPNVLLPKYLFSHLYNYNYNNYYYYFTFVTNTSA